MNAKTAEKNDLFASHGTQKPKAKRTVRSGHRPEGADTPKPAGTGLVVHKPTPPAAPKSLLEIIAEASANPNVDVAKMKELLALKRDIEREEKERVFTAAIAAVKDNLPPVILADSRNAHTKSWWARYEKISKIVDPIVRQQGLVLSFGMAESSVPDHYRVICDVTHTVSGFTKRYFLDGPSDAAGAKGGGSKTPIQGVISTIAYLQRILKGLIFDVIIEKADRDGNAPEGEMITEEQGDELLRLCADKGINREVFQTAFRVNDIYALPAKRFSEAKAKLEIAPVRVENKGESR